LANLSDMEDSLVQLRLGDLGNPRWYSKPAETNLMAVGYRMMCVEDSALVPPKIVDLEATRAHLILASLPYNDGARLVPTSANNWRVETGALRTTPMGPHLVLVTPIRVVGVDVAEATFRERIATAVGLITAWQGPNVSYEPVMELMVPVVGDQVEYCSAPIKNPLSMRQPELTESELSRLRSAVEAIAELPEATQNRIRLSLRWFEHGTRSDGIDAFLQLWIAIETLTMPGTDIRPLLNLLSGAYGISARELRERYALGRICGLRGDIVHQGRRPPMLGVFLDFVGAIYADALMVTLGLPSSRRADEVLAKSPIDPLSGI
jgi:hypothetical protein